MKTIKALFILLVSLGSVAQAQNPPQFTISTVVGSAPQSNISGTSAKLGGGLLSVAVDSSGNVFFAVQDTVMRLSAAGQLTIVAGNGTYGFSGDGGPATSAQLAGPGGVALDSIGTLYIADRFNNRIRKISNGVITTVVGNGTQGFGGDNGSAMTAMINYPAAIAVDSTGNLYIADAYNNRVRKVSSGVITTVAGNGTSGLGGDNGAATSALLSEPNGVAVDSAGNLYISDYGTSRIRKVANGVITTVVGGGSSLGDNGPATSAQLREPGGVAIDSSGSIYIGDTYNNRIRKVSNGVITTFAGNGTASFSGDGGPPTSAQLSLPSGVAVDASGNLYIADYGNSSVRKVSGGVITTVAGNGTFTSVTVGGQSAFIDYISPTQVNVQIPSSAPTGSQQLTVTSPSGTSASYSLNVRATEPGLLAPSSFLISGTQYIVALFTDGATYVLPPGAIAGITSQRAKPGDTIVLYGVGFGTTTPNIAAGQIVSQTNALAASLQISLGDQPTTIAYAGLAPGFVGLYQFNVVVPNVAANDKTPLTFNFGGSAGVQTLYLAVGN